MNVGLLDTVTINKDIPDYGVVRGQRGIIVQILEDEMEIQIEEVDERDPRLVRVHRSDLELFAHPRILRTEKRQ